MDESWFLDESELAARYAGAPEEEIESFWERVSRHGTPLVDPESLKVTFVWRMRPTPERGAVYLFANRVTDKANVDLGMLDNVEGTDIWVRTLTLPATRRMTYGFLELPPGERPAPGPPRFGPGGLRFDPLNPLPRVGEEPGGFGISVHRGWLAPQQPHWESAAATAHEIDGTVHETSLPLPGEGGTPTKRAFLYLPAAGVGAGTAIGAAAGNVAGPGARREAELGFVTMFDAEKWFRDPGLPRALDHAIARGDLPPFAVLGVENLSIPDRMATLGTDTAFLDAVSGELTTWAEATATRSGYSLAPRGSSNRIITGESLGGLTALVAALHLPGEWGTVLAQSPSMWRTPHATGSPRDLGTREGGDWITEQFRRTSRPDSAPRVLVTVGTAEGPSIAKVHELVLACRAAGWDCEDSVYDGGHDDSCWRGELFALLGAGPRPVEGDSR